MMSVRARMMRRSSTSSSCHSWTSQRRSGSAARAPLVESAGANARTDVTCSPAPPAPHRSGSEKDQSRHEKADEKADMPTDMGTVNACA